MKVLYVEDQRHLALAVEKILKQNNYSVDLAYNGEDGLDCALTGTYDIIILDIMLPRMDGVSVLKALRAKGITAPVIMLTAKAETGEKIEGLDSGADDYLAKPFQTGELLARMRALGRRMEKPLTAGTLVFEDIELNPHSLDLRRGADSFVLTLKESQLMELLIINHGVIISTEVIIEKVWGYDSDAADNHVQVYIAFLRKKLTQLGARAYIQTVRGAGYVLRAGNGEDSDV